MALGRSYGAETRRRGVAEARSESALIAHTAIEPLFDGQALDHGLTPAEDASLKRLVTDAIADRNVLRLRVRDLSGKVLFSDDGSGFNDKPEDESAEAARGETIARLTRLNSDNNDLGPRGVAAVEVYRPLLAGAADHQVGVLELYLPYSPISREVS
ncbi:MAG TPA: bifunctional diguanylate cyclase/phosphodiesterase, partial [Acidimicrobiia bacterium]|nr:bifunctional diguanylate cyclase/phosphodiesterase [Acidimicrobiia bacterium]